MAKPIKNKIKRTNVKKNKEIKQIDEMRLSILSSFNNTIITASAFETGNVLDWSSSGRVGFKGTKKGTPYAATTAMKDLLVRILKYEPKKFHISVEGAGNGRDAALRAIIGTNIKVGNIQDTTPLPHNGCRPKKARRV